MSALEWVDLMNVHKVSFAYFYCLQKESMKNLYGNIVIYKLALTTHGILLYFFETYQLEFSLEREVSHRVATNCQW